MGLTIRLLVVEVLKLLDHRLEDGSRVADHLSPSEKALLLSLIDDVVTKNAIDTLKTPEEKTGQWLDSHFKE